MSTIRIQANPVYYMMKYMLGQRIEIRETHHILIFFNHKVANLYSICSETDLINSPYWMFFTVPWPCTISQGSHTSLFTQGDLCYSNRTKK